ncbi:NADH:ubiquinone reductase (H(+)-translocating) [Handroanthus impetiginosus]|uniref:NADH:ubiquinone reductase (H(+)-translocating) n=1 Tax=Handroanthus impetiginosus TaxID=429701 RepID=A0A2G9FW22_9LAMI|nr:NADH:ubiquinone reductase (H(+)-translocating) [Handroanthus impetiginosus]
MYLTLIILPLLGSIISGLLGRKIGVSGSHLITCSCVITTTILAVLSFFEVGLNNISVYINLFSQKMIERKMEYRGSKSIDSMIVKEQREYLHGVGSINLSNVRDIANYSINSLEGWQLLITHLDRYPLLTQKYGDYLLFKKAFSLLKKKVHLSHEGLNEIINIKSAMNLGLSNTLKSEFPNYIPAKRERLFRDNLRFRITQHSRDLELMEKIVSYIKSGKIYKYGGKSAVSFTIVDFTDITNNLLPFMEKHYIIGIKHYDYLD